MARVQRRGLRTQERKNSFEHAQPTWLPDATWLSSDSLVAAKLPPRLSVFLKGAARFRSGGRIRFLIPPILRTHCQKQARRLPGASTWWGISETPRTDHGKFSWRVPTPFV